MSDTGDNKATAPAGSPIEQINGTLYVDEETLNRLGALRRQHGNSILQELRNLIDFWMDLGHTYETHRWCRTQIVYPREDWDDDSAPLREVTAWMNMRPAKKQRHTSPLEVPNLLPTKAYQVTLPRYCFTGLEAMARLHGVNQPTELHMAAGIWARLDATARKYPGAWLLVNTIGKTRTAMSWDPMGFLRSQRPVPAPAPAKARPAAQRSSADSGPHTLS